MYQALYRIYRPETFDEVLGQEHIVKILKNQIKNGTTSHAYMFCGTRGTGKTTMARLLAKGLNCEAQGSPDAGAQESFDLASGGLAGAAEAQADPGSALGGSASGGSDPDDVRIPCGKCSACQAIKDGTYMDVIEIDAASNNGVDNIRELKESVQYPPVMGRKKVYIIDEVHMLSSGAENALLKTLEEPPEYVTFILATTDPQKVTATIASRCMRLDFKRVPETQLKDGIRRICSDRGIQMSDEAMAIIAANADGSVRDCFSLLDQCIAGGEKVVERDDILDILGTAGTESFIELTHLVATHQVSDALLLLDEMLADGKDTTQLMKDWLSHYRNLLVTKFVRTPESMLNMSSENIRRLKAQAERSDIEDIDRAIIELSRTIADAKASSQNRVLLELCIVKLASAGTEMMGGSRVNKAQQIADRAGSTDRSSAAGRPAAPERPVQTGRLAAAGAQASAGKPAAGRSSSAGRSAATENTAPAGRQTPARDHAAPGKGAPSDRQTPARDHAAPGKGAPSDRQTPARDHAAPEKTASARGSAANKHSAGDSPAANRHSPGDSPAGGRHTAPDDLPPYPDEPAYDYDIPAGFYEDMQPDIPAEAYGNAWENTPTDALGSTLPDAPHDLPPDAAGSTQADSQGSTSNGITTNAHGSTQPDARWSARTDAHGSTANAIPAGTRGSTQPEAQHDFPSDASGSTHHDPQPDLSLDINNGAQPAIPLETHEATRADGTGLEDLKTLWNNVFEGETLGRGIFDLIRSGTTPVSLENDELTITTSNPVTKKYTHDNKGFLEEMLEETAGRKIRILIDDEASSVKHSTPSDRRSEIKKASMDLSEKFGLNVRITD